MCTLVVARDVFPDKRLVVLANRDEFLARPSAGPELWRDGRIPFVAPRDLLAGGSWLGMNARGVIAAITNRRSVPKRDDRRSRGELVVRALGFPTAKEAAEGIASLEGEAYNGFHLAIVDRASAHLVVGDGERMRSAPLEPGVHVVTEAGFEGMTERERLASRWMGEMSAKRAPKVEEFHGLLSLHRDEPFDGMCNHADAFGYGTKSSTIMMLDEQEPLMWHCNERPCAGSFHDERALLATLGACRINPPAS